jgi:hypothetical protein
MRFRIFLYDPIKLTKTLIGTVNASNTPSAQLQAFKKFGIKDSATQRRVGAERVVPLRPSPPIPDDGRAALHDVMAAFNSFMRSKLK